MEGTKEIDELMIPISSILKKHISYPSNDFTEVYNKIYTILMNHYSTSDKANQVLADLAIKLKQQTCKHDFNKLTDKCWNCGITLEEFCYNKR